MSYDSKPDEHLAKKVNTGALWVTFSSVFIRILNTVSAIILARILAPDDFGLMAIAVTIITFSQGATQTGFESALIQKYSKTENYLNTAWTIDLFRNIILFLIIFLLAPLLASFFKDPRIIIILRVISLSLVFQGLRNIGIVYFRKNLDFKKQFILEIIPSIVYISTVIPLTFLLRSVWALVWGNMANSISLCLTSYFIHPYRPKLDFDTKKAKKLFDFGKWILGSSILVMIREQGLNMFVGRLFGIPILGFYNRANAFSTIIFQQVSEVVWKVGFPAFSQIQLDANRLKNAYLKTLQILTFIAIPMAGGLYVLSEDFVHLFLTDKWISIVPLIQILCLQAVLGFINTPASIIFQASGKPSIVTKISIIGIIILIIIIYPLSLIWGIAGALIAIFISILITSPLAWYLAIKITKCSVLEFSKLVLLPIINTVIMMSVILLIKNSIDMKINFAVFFGLIIAGIFSYFSITYLMDKLFKYGIYIIIKQSFNSLR